MSIDTGPGYRISYMETEVTCPICTAAFDVGEKAGKAKHPMFKMKCPHCKGWIGVSMPIFGGTTECFEWDVPKSVKRERTKSPFLVNGKEEVRKILAADDDDLDDDECVLA